MRGVCLCDVSTWQCLSVGCGFQECPYFAMWAPAVSDCAHYSSAYTRPHIVAHIMSAAQGHSCTQLHTIVVTKESGPIVAYVLLV